MPSGKIVERYSEHAGRLSRDGLLQGWGWWQLGWGWGGPGLNQRLKNGKKMITISWNPPPSSSLFPPAAHPLRCPSTHTHTHTRTAFANLPLGCFSSSFAVSLQSPLPPNRRSVFYFFASSFSFSSSLDPTTHCRRRVFVLLPCNAQPESRVPPPCPSHSSRFFFSSAKGPAKLLAACQTDPLRSLHGPTQASSIAFVTKKNNRLRDPPRPLSCASIFHREHHPQERPKPERKHPPHLTYIATICDFD